jgi:hypothetical protein
LAELEAKKAKKEEAKEPAEAEGRPATGDPGPRARPEGNAEGPHRGPHRRRHRAGAPLADEFKLRVVLEHATEGGAAAEAIAKAKVPVVVGPALPLRRLLGRLPEPLRGDRRGAGQGGRSRGDRLVRRRAAGQWGPGASRFLAESAALAASQGLTREQALAAITLEAAKILGIDKTHGSIEKGKVADLVLLSGEPFESGTVVEQTS